MLSVPTLSVLELPAESEAITKPVLEKAPVALMVLPWLACSVPELVRLAELLDNVVLASSVPELVKPLPIASAMLVVDCKMPELFRLESVRLAVLLPSTVPDCVLKVALLPLMVSALPA